MVRSVLGLLVTAAFHVLRKASELGPAAEYALVRPYMFQRLAGLCVAAAMFGLITTNPSLTAVGCLFPAMLFFILWRTGEPPVFLFGLLFQWLQVFIPVVAANIQGETLRESFGGPELTQSAWYSYAGLLVLAGSIRVGQSLWRRAIPTADALSKHLHPGRLVAAYLLSLVLVSAFQYAGVRIGGLRQLSASIATIKWVPVFLLAWSSFSHRRHYGSLAFVTTIELVVGFSGFFSGFKQVLLLLLVVVTGASIRSRQMPWAWLTIIASLTLLLAAIWQGVKSDYRLYLSQGTGKQVVTVGFLERMQHLGHLMGRIQPGRVSEGLGEGMERLGYLKFFAESIRNVPQAIPHENGQLWLGAVQHVLMPRVFFPHKPAINDSDRTNKYTGLGVAGAEQGTSISIGYMGESYIDFGFPGMLFPIFLLGVFYGAAYKYFTQPKDSQLALLGSAIATPLLFFTIYLFETSNIKIVGASVGGFGVMAVLFAMFGSSCWNHLTTSNGKKCEFQN